MKKKLHRFSGLRARAWGEGEGGGGLDKWRFLRDKKKRGEEVMEIGRRKEGRKEKKKEEKSDGSSAT